MVSYHTVRTIRLYLFFFNCDLCTLNNGVPYVWPRKRKGSVKMCHYLSSTQIFEWYVIKVVLCLHSAVHWSAYSTLPFLKNTTTTMLDGVHVYCCHCLCLIQKWKKSPVSQWILTMSRRPLWMVAVTWTFLLTVSFSDLTDYFMILPCSVSSFLSV